MKSLTVFLLLLSPLFGDDTTPADPAKALISSDFAASIEPLGSRTAQTNLTVVYLDTTKDDQFVDVAAIRADTSALIRGAGATAPVEAYAKAVAKGLADKYPQIAGLTVTVYTSFTSQGTPLYVTTLTRLAPELPGAVKAAVTQKLLETRNAQSRIVR